MTTRRSEDEEPVEPTGGEATTSEPVAGDDDSRFRVLVENMSDIVVELDAKSYISWLSPSIRDVLGRDPAELVGQSVRPILHPDDRAAVKSGLVDAYRDMAEVEFSYRLLHVDGTWRWIDGSGRCFIAEGNEKHFVAVGRDVTELKALVQSLERQHKADQRIKDLSRRFIELGAGEIDEAIHTAMNEIVDLAGADRGFLIGTEEGAPLAFSSDGWSAEDVEIGNRSRLESLQGKFVWADGLLRSERVVHIPDCRAISEHAGPEEADFARRGVKSVLLIALETQDRSVGRLGLERVHEARGWSDQEIAEMQRVGYVLSSVLRRKVAELALARQVSMERHVSKLSKRLLASTSHDVCEVVSSALEAIARLARADRAFLLPLGPETDRAGSLVSRLGSMQWATPDLVAQPPQLPTWCRDELQAGRIVHLGKWTSSSEEARGAYADLSARGVRSFVGVPVASARSPDIVLALECHVLPRRWTKQEVGLFGLIGELFSTFLHRQESERALQESRDQLRQAQKMDAVGRLAGGIAHDFNNLLTIIIGFSRSLQQELSEAPTTLTDLNEISRAAERAADLTRQLLAFSRRDSSRAERIDLNRVVGDVRGMLGRLLGTRAEVAFEVASMPLYVHADPRQLEQVLVNLAVNARDAMPEGGRITVSTSRMEIGAEACARWGVPAPGTYHGLEVSDTGVGMSAKELELIFEPFYTTKDVGKGTGLGLSIAYSVARDNGGTLAVDSTPGRGSSFVLLLPRAELERQGASPSRTSAGPTGNETLLIVEDEPGVRRLMVRFASRAGYRVLEAANAAAALEVADQQGDAIDLLVTDVMMVGQSGVDLARALHAERPGLPIVYVSGHPLEGVGPEADAMPAGRLLRKPFESEELLEQIREALDAR